MSDQFSLWAPVTPEYVRPTMAEIERRPPNGLRVVGSFSGCGGSSLGLKMAGWEVAAAVEFVPEAANTYRANFPRTRLYEQDVRDLKPETILSDLGIKRGQLDLFEGSPPCASFSAAGNRDKSWGEEKTYSDTKQRTDDLFWEWARILDGLQPRAFIAENVPGLETGRALEEYAHLITRDLGRLGYRVSSRVMNSANFGVPQIRRRLVFLGFREDLDLLPTYPEPRSAEPHTTQQALESVRPDDPDHAPYLEGSSMVGKAVGRTWEALTQRNAVRESHGDRDAIPPLEMICARCGKELENHEVTRRDNRWRPLDALCKNGEKAIVVKDYFMLQVPDLDKPCQTLTATGAGSGAASVTHPTECRKMTPAEAKAICGFPPDFILTGTREQRYERLGRAVTPPLYEALGHHLAEILLNARKRA